MISKKQQAEELRQQAEEKFQTLEPSVIAELSKDEVEGLFHELRVHQIELEMQNDELRQAQDELELARSRYFDLYDLAPVGYLTLSKQGLILEINLTAVTMLGVPRSALVKRPLRQFIFKDDQDIYYLHRKPLFETGEPQTFELRLLKSDGELFWARLDVTAVQDADATPVCRIILTDISERKLAEEEQKKLQEQLVQAHKMEFVGRLAGGVAHDFNNMLEVIIGRAYMIKQQMDSAMPIYKYIEDIENSARRSADLTRQLLAFARKQTAAPKVLDLNETLKDMLRMLQRLIGEHIELSWLPGQNLGPVNMDPSQIDQILANLCVNARDAIVDVGTITIETATAVFDDDYCEKHVGVIPGEFVLLTVSDNGRGMDSETLAHVFEPFFTTKDVGKGTGLGLATIYGIVQQNDGFINVSSEPDRGTTFQIYLPRHTSKPDHVQEQRPEPIVRGNETILLVEDEPIVLELVTDILESLNYTVVGAGTPADAIRLAKDHTGQIHLLMTDVVMPEMNGRDLARNILACDPNIKCLFMSGYTADIIAQQGMLDEGINFIQKPFSIKDLSAKVREVMARD